MLRQLIDVTFKEMFTSNMRLSDLVKHFNTMLPEKSRGKADGEMTYLERG